MAWALSFVGTTAACSHPIVSAPRPQPEALEVADPMPWPRGLPDPIEKPDGYVELDPALASAVAQRLELAAGWPALCRSHLEAQRGLDGAWCEGVLEVRRLEAEAAVAEVEARTLAWWEAALVVGGALVAGGLAGFCVGAVWSGGFGR